MTGEVMNMDANRLLARLEPGSVDLVLFHPPSQFGVGEVEEETTVDEMALALHPLAVAAREALCKGGSTIFIGGPEIMAAWEFAASWAGLRFVVDITVLWNSPVGAGLDSLASQVRRHVRPGLRHGPIPDRLHVNSNVIICDVVPQSERHNVTQLPVELYTFLVEISTAPGDLVVDPFCGAGSALEAAAMCDRRWIGGDLDQAQCTISRVRMARWAVGLRGSDSQPSYLWTGVDSLLEI